MVITKDPSKIKLYKLILYPFVIRTLDTIFNYIGSRTNLKCYRTLECQLAVLETQFLEAETACLHVALPLN